MKNHLLNAKQQNFQNSRYYFLFSKPINPVDRVKEILPWKVSPSEHKSFKQNLQKTGLNSYFIYTVCVIVPSLLLTFRIFPLLVESSAGREHCSFARCLCKANDAVKSVLPWSPTIKFRSKPSRACLLSLQQLRRGGCFPFVCNETSGETNVLGLPPLTYNLLSLQRNLLNWGRKGWVEEETISPVPRTRKYEEFARSCGAFGI